MVLPLNDNSPPSHLTCYYDGQHPRDWETKSVQPNQIATLVLSALLQVNNPVTITHSEAPPFQMRLITFRLGDANDQSCNCYLQIPNYIFSERIFPRLTNSLRAPEISIDRFDEMDELVPVEEEELLTPSFIPKFILTRTQL